MELLWFLIYVAIIWAVYWFFPRSEKSLTGQRVLITGGGSGIGRLMAIEMAKEGCSVVLWDINGKAAEDVKKELENLGLPSTRAGKYASYQVDVTKRENVYQIAEQVKRDIGQIDLLVNNAGVVAGEYFTELKDEQIERVMGVNTMGVMWVTKAFLKDMMTANKGHVVTIASAASTTGCPKLSDYVASKFAAFGFAESIRLELRKKRCTGVKTTIVCPFYIRTGMFEGVTSASPLLPVLTPSEVVTRIMKAIKINQEELYIPELVRLNFFLRFFTPPFLRDILGDILGVSRSMDDFQGLRRVAH